MRLGRAENYNFDEKIGYFSRKAIFDFNSPLAAEEVYTALEKTLGSESADIKGIDRILVQPRHAEDTKKVIEILDNEQDRREIREVLED